MPATAAAKGKGAASKPSKRRTDEAPLATLVARLPRADLEALLLSLEDQVDLRSALEAKLEPEQRKKARVAHGPVGASESLVKGDGPFAGEGFNEDLMMKILCAGDGLDTRSHSRNVFRCVPVSGLDTLSKLAFTGCVCKGLRSLRSKPNLWHKVKLEGGKFSAKGAVRFFVGSNSPLPSPKVVEELEIQGEKVIDAKSFKAILKAATHAHTIILSGKKLSPDALQLLTKPRSVPLTRLAVAKVSSNPQNLPAVLLDILGANPQLADLSVDLEVDEQWVHAAGERASSARNGGRSLLHTLLVGSHYGWSWRPSLSVRAFSRLSAAFPELTKLTVDAVAGFSSIGMPGPAWLPMPQLRELRVDALGTFLTCHYVNTAQLTDFLAHIAAAAPDLRILHLKRGKQHISGADAARGVTAAPLPRVGAAISGVGTLRRLEELHLDTVEMLPGEMAGCDLPLLRVLKLSECGPQAAAAAVVLSAAAPQLQELSISMGFQRHGISMAHGATGAGSKPSADVESDLSGLRSSSLSTLTLLPVAAPCVSASLLGIGRSGGCPSLSSIKCSNAAYPCFDAAAPFPRLASLDLSHADNAAAALLANLRAPMLSSLKLALIGAGGVVNAAKQPSPALADAYNALRSHCPKLPPLRVEQLAPGPTAPPPDYEHGGGAGQDSD